MRSCLMPIYRRRVYIRNNVTSSRFKSFSKIIFRLRPREPDQDDSGNLTLTTDTNKENVIQQNNDNEGADIPKNFEVQFLKRHYSKLDMKFIKHVVKKKSENKDAHVDRRDNVNNNFRVNEINMQMLSKSLHEQIFKDAYEQKNISEEEIKSLKHNLSAHGIKVEHASRLPDVDIKIPPLEGDNIEEHFYNIGKTQVEPYVSIVKKIMEGIPKMPDKWLLQEGWTRYTPDGIETVDYPLEDGIIFDVEVCMSEGPLPTLATAVTNQAWYGWVSKSLKDGLSTNFEGQQFYINQLVPMESKATEYGDKLNIFQKKPKVVVGHNVSFDRSKVKEQYWLNHTGLRFIDTMSLHISISGINTYQRAILNSKKDSYEKSNLTMQTSMNSLAEVHKFYCGYEVKKNIRSVFVKGTLADVREDFNNLMTYCANDTIATHNILCHLFPLFEERFPHPVTLAGMLELGTAYLPTNSNWQRYLDNSEFTFEDFNYETKFILSKRADVVCQLMHNEKYKEDLWMWDEDWSTQDIKVKKTGLNSQILKMKYKAQETKMEETDAQKYLTDDEEEEDPLEKEFGYLKETRKLLHTKIPHMSGYPAWYRKLCLKEDDKDWSPGPQNISTSMQIVPKLLNLTWECYPLHYIREKGWGILVPYNNNLSMKTEVPLKQLLAQCPLPHMEYLHNDPPYTILNLNTDVQKNLDKNLHMYLHKKDFWGTKKKAISLYSQVYKGSAVWCNVDIDDCCYFFKLPHKDGPKFNVGNPLAKDFLNKFSENVLAGLDSSAAEVLNIAKMVSYWRNNRHRIMSQFVIWFENFHLPSTVKKSKRIMRYGAIIPLVVPCGTLTRRAVEPTWMTASNAHEERVGSELRAMIQAPPGYNIIGADVDSQELWISSMLGDAHYKKIHGATPFGWMTLVGTKANETDMHSVTAAAIGISRSQAKVINYARIYGAGHKFAERLLKQFNPSMSNPEAANKSRKMFTMTKGTRLFRLRPEYISNDIEDNDYSLSEAVKIAKLHSKSVPDMFGEGKWTGGSESAMFNRLEEIAGSPHPVTPFLNSRLTRALENQTDSVKYLPTKVNWVVQSGAVDFLHLMLVSMKWLMKDNARFCLSFHDEVRYLVPSRYKYNAALAMHVTNLLTRAFCASRLDMKDLPMSVAFFTSVEVDTVLRKESSHDCKTPSNPHGLETGYQIPPGESLDVWSTIEKSGGSLGPWHETGHDMKKQKKSFD